MTNDTITRFTFRIPNTLMKIIKEHSRKKGISKNAIILQILWEWAKTSKQDLLNVTPPQSQQSQKYIARRYWLHGMSDKR